MPPSSTPASKVPKCLVDEGKVCLCMTQFIAVIWKRIIAVIVATFAVAKRKPEKNSGLYGIRTLDLCDTGAALLPTEHCTGIAQVQGSNPVQAWIFFRLYFRNCKSCVYHCDDLLSYNYSPRSSHTWFSYIDNYSLLRWKQHFLPMERFAWMN